MTLFPLEIDPITRKIAEYIVVHELTYQLITASYTGFLAPSRANHPQLRNKEAMADQLRCGCRGFIDYVAVKASGYRRPPNLTHDGHR